MKLRLISQGALKETFHSFANCGIGEAAGSPTFKQCGRRKTVLYCGQDYQTREFEAAHCPRCIAGRRSFPPPLSRAGVVASSERTLPPASGRQSSQFKHYSPTTSLHRWGTQKVPYMRMRACASGKGAVGGAVLFAGASAAWHECACALAGGRRKAGALFSELGVVRERLFYEATKPFACRPVAAFRCPAGKILSTRSAGGQL